MTKVFTEKVCKRCNKIFTPTVGTQLYCGSKTMKLGCSYENQLEYFKKINKSPERKDKIIKLNKSWKKLQRVLNTDYAKRQRLSMKKWAENNIDLVKDNRKKWRIDNLDYVLFKNKQRMTKLRTLGNIKYNEWVALVEKHNHTCVYCGISEDELKVKWGGKQFIKLTMDHIIPISKGGLNVIENIQPLCISCNTRKGAAYENCFC